MQVWLYGNPRSALLLGAAGVALVIVGVLLFVMLDRTSSWGKIAGALLLGLGMLGSLAAVVLARAARIAYRNREVLFYIRSGHPQRIPLDAVEVFFLGQGEGAVGNQHATPIETANVVVRLAERAVDYQQGKTAPLLARWCDGYITIYGTWCQPLNVAVVNRLNHRLAEAKRQS